MGGLVKGFGLSSEGGENLSEIDKDLLENDFYKPIRLDIEDFAKKWKILGLLVVFNDYKVGTYVKYYYYNDKSFIAKKFAFDPGALTEILIVSKHTEIIQGIYKNKAIVKMLKLRDSLGRDTFGYILVELSNRASIKKGMEIIKRIEKALSIGNIMDAFRGNM